MEEREYEALGEGREPEVSSVEASSPVQEKKKRRFTLRGCFLIKLFAYLLFSAAVATTIVGALGCVLAIDYGMYRNEMQSSVTDMLQGEAYRIGEGIISDVIYDKADEKNEFLQANHVEAEVGYLKSDVETVWIWRSKPKWKLQEGYQYVDAYIYLPDKGDLMKAAEQKYDWTGDCAVVRVHFDMSFPSQTRAKKIYEFGKFLYLYRYECIAVTLIGCAIALFSCVFLLCSAGHKNGREGIVPSPFHSLHFDFLTALSLGIVVSVGGVGSEISYNALDLTGGTSEVILGSLYILFCAMFGMLYLMEFATRMKQGKWWKHTLVYAVFAFVFRLLGKMVRTVAKAIRRAPLIRSTLLIVLGISFCEFVVVVGIYDRGAVAVLWLLEKLVLLPFIFYLAYCCKKLFLAGRQLAEGKENYRVDTTRMIGSLKEHGEDLNNISEGIGKAVDARMRSERLKTELITNVSHDIKTPLTSIINYATLISEMETGNEQLDEYSEVLVRQSNRLKKLLEDLVEASKASTGNLEVQMGRCDVGVLLTQAAGEYETRMTEKGLEIRSTIPEEPVFIQADGRHLWRVFDNLMNNILKYAQENSRVYLSLSQKESRVEVIFRNMSKYPLDISAEELEERFARGDKSRHLEGNGLGLAIAKSLTELQKGTFEIIVDGDLFKAVLTFPADEE